MVAELLDKYIWLVNTISRKGEYGITLKELQDKWEAKYDESYARRTFNNHREAIFDIFGIEIGCNRSDNTYFIEEAAGGLGGDSSWLIDTFTVNQALSQSKTRLKGRISVEEIPSGHIHLTPLMDAMSENKVIDLEYRKYDSQTSSIYTLQPYALKEFERRWYLIGECIRKDGEDRSGLRIFGLDRIISLHETGKNFTMKKGFNADELFATSFGIYLPHEKARTVRFKVSRKEARYITDLPLHSSQKKVNETEDEVTFEIFAVPDRNMLMSFCKYGSNLEVLEPAEVVQEVRDEVTRMYCLYNKEQ